jgi:peptidoglycan/LPS O-acetylase OafA/YrhL
MAIGGIGAYYLYTQKWNILKPIFSSFAQIGTTSLVLGMMFLGVEIPFINHEFYSFLFIIIILNFAANPNCLASLENKILDYLGKISYSLYMWHNIAIICGLHVARYFNPQLDDALSNIIYYAVTFILTFIFSALSYEYFEMKFLKYKHLFTKVQSGNLTKNDAIIEAESNENKQIIAVKNS